MNRGLKQKNIKQGEIWITNLICFLFLKVPLQRAYSPPENCYSWVAFYKIQNYPSYGSMILLYMCTMETYFHCNVWDAKNKYTM